MLQIGCTEGSGGVGADNIKYTASPPQTVYLYRPMRSYICKWKTHSGMSHLIKISICQHRHHLYMHKLTFVPNKLQRQYKFINLLHYKRNIFTIYPVAWQNSVHKKLSTLVHRVESMHKHQLDYTSHRVNLNLYFCFSYKWFTPTLHSILSLNWTATMSPWKARFRSFVPKMRMSLIPSCIQHHNIIQDHINHFIHMNTHYEFTNIRSYKILLPERLYM